MIHHLRGVGMVRRDVQPEPDLLGELFRASAGRFACSMCGAIGLIVERIDDLDDEAWGMARQCEVCHRPIDRQRLEAVPDAVRCVACQVGAERGDAAAEDYCPKCGGLMVVRPTRGAGITRYQLRCPDCGR
jgi:predicted RNA-binding Zn-ribbon protein involved in translation (DUF1610 family)